MNGTYANVKAMSQLRRENIREDRFQKYVDRRGADECWPWIGGKIPGGYGMFSVKNKAHGSHRVAHVLATGEDVGGKVVRHLCDNPGCVNPGHLTTGTQADNMRDRMDRGHYTRGEAHYNTRLTAELVTEARRRHAEGESVASLARAMGVNSGTMHNAIHRATWKHIP